MVFPTNGFSSNPVGVRFGLTDHVENGTVVTAAVNIALDGSTYRLSEDQTQALFSAVGNSIKTYLTGLFPTAGTMGPIVTYTASTDLTIS